MVILFGCKRNLKKQQNKIKNQKIHHPQDPSKVYIPNCPEGEMLFGGYSSHLTCTEDFVVRVPDEIPMEKAGPLLCAGITTYSPLMYFGKILSAVNNRSQLSVGVAGLGGLGHMAVKIAKKLGHTVTVLSRSPRKKEAALAMGADSFVDV
jgi:D-arabinose 1-dehydrogenase-like Zn-dependent alcohol dehydrogenase